MVSSDGQTLPIRVSAAAWLARLRSEKHTAEDERAFQEWLAADPAHAAAFEVMNAVWDAARPVRRDLRGTIPNADRRISRRTVFGGVAVAAGLGGTLLLTESVQADVYRTEIGEQKHVRLHDGSELFLDTNTKVAVAFNQRNRKATLEYGCANFKLATDASRPFAVNVADYVVVCNHSTFDASRDGDNSSILMLQGQAAVESNQNSVAPSRILNGGERLTAFQNSVKLDRPDLFPLLAWHTGQAVFRDETLAQAAYEMNRYSKLRLEIADPRIQGLKLSGMYRVGDNVTFALALANLLPVLVRPLDDRIEIIGDNKRLRQM
jgi:transmembrane sensor